VSPVLDAAPTALVATLAVWLRPQTGARFSCRAASRATSTRSTTKACCSHTCETSPCRWCST